MLAVGGRRLGCSWEDARAAKRDDIEKDLVFMGLVVFQNKLKVCEKRDCQRLREKET